MSVSTLSARFTRTLSNDTVRQAALMTLPPVMLLLAYAAFGPKGLFFVSALFPGFVAYLLVAANREKPQTRQSLPSRRDTLEDALNGFLRQASGTPQVTACITMQIDDFAGLQKRLGRPGVRQISEQCQKRLALNLRAADIIAELDDGAFAVALTPAARFDLETLLQIAVRLQTSMGEAVHLDQTSLRISVSVGFCSSSQLPEPNGRALIEAAEAAVSEAKRHGAGAIRAYSSELHDKRLANHALLREVGDALATGQIRPWFQPQISTDTGQVTGFEALARWIHPEKGMVSPAEFLPLLEQAGLMESLSDVMLTHALTALRAWDRAGLSVPRVGVNFSGAELANPTLVEKVAWELDRFGLTPDRLAVEVLESVIADAPDDVVCRNISGLSGLGCLIDLDDFGTGHASITSIRRFAVGRIKIDRAFVARVDQDREQQRMVGAILTMAEQLDLECLAEGVETAGEHAMLSQLGCAHVQGFGLGRPMPFEDTNAWLAKHKASIVKAPILKRNSG